MITLLMPQTHEKFYLSAFLSRLRYHQPQNTNSPSSWFSTHDTVLNLDLSLSVLSLFSCQMQFLFPEYLPLWCPPRLSSWPPTLCRVHNPALYSQFISFFRQPPLCRWHTSFTLTHKTLCSRSLPGWLPIFSLSTLPKLNFFLLDFTNN